MFSETLAAPSAELPALFGAPASCNLVARWTSPTTARRYLEQNQMRPSWSHFVPQLGKTRNGICFDMMTTSSWRGDHSIGFLTRPQDLPQPRNAYAFEGHRTYCLASRLQWTLDKGRLHQELAAVQANLQDYVARPDELFVTHTVDNLGERLCGIVLLSGLNAPVFDGELREFVARHNVPLLEMSRDKFFDVRYSLQGLGGLLPAVATARAASAKPCFGSAAPKKPRRMTRMAKSYQVKPLAQSPAKPARPQATPQQEAQAA
jgi:hypothetical protein